MRSLRSDKAQASPASARVRQSWSDEWKFVFLVRILDIVVDDIEGISEAYCRNGAPDLSCVFWDFYLLFVLRM